MRRNVFFMASTMKPRYVPVSISVPTGNRRAYSFTTLCLKRSGGGHGLPLSSHASSSFRCRRAATTSYRDVLRMSRSSARFILPPSALFLPELMDDGQVDLLDLFKGEK